MAESMATTNFSLNCGHKMPSVGMGTFRIRTEANMFHAVDEGLAAGYRLFDTAAVYRNEAHLRNAFSTLLPKYGLDRDDVFITTKISPADHGGTESVTRAYQHSLNNLGIEYADLYLIHFPGAQRLESGDKRNTKLRHATWQAMLDLYDEGLVNAIGVSNFTIQHLQDLMRFDDGVIPAVNQVEWHPFYYQTYLLEYCKANNIVLQAYSSFGGKSVSNDTLLNHPVVTKIAKTLEVTNAQVLLAWALQQEVAVIPKSMHADHIKANISLNFKIPDACMKELDELGQNNTKYAWNPNNVA